MRRIAVVFSLLWVVACVSTPGPTADNMQATVAQAVQATLTTVPTAAPPPTPTVTPYSPQPLPPTQVWPSEVTRLLPAPLYYLSDGMGSQQIWRVETNGAGAPMITNLPQPIDTYDVSQATGRIAYISNNQLFISDALDHDPQLIDAPNEDLSNYASVAWSPDGTRLAFTGQSGVWLYEVGEKNLHLLLSTRGADVLPRPDVLRLTGPTPWSADGRTLLINSLSADWGEVNYLPLDGSTGLIRVGLSICDEVHWSRDSHTLYGSRYTMYGPCDNPGLDRWDMLSHSLTPLFGSESITLTQHVLARFVRATQEGPDGSLYYFYGSADLPYSDTEGTLFMVRSAPDGVTDRRALRSDSFINVYEVLWAPDMSAAVMVEGSPDEPAGAYSTNMGTIKLLTIDNKPALSNGSQPGFALAGRGSQLHWGKAE